MRTSELYKSRNKIAMICIAFIVGIFGGFGAVIFRKLIAFIYNLSFSTKLSLTANETIHAPPSHWGAWIILLPIIGSLMVTWLIQNFAKNEKGLSVSAIINAIYDKHGKIKPASAFAKILASAISIGTGGSVGREGPIAMIVAATTSLFGDLMKIPIHQKNVLIAAGAAAGTATIFNAPLAGIMFAIELFLVSFNMFNIVIIMISTLTATLIGQYFFGTESIFFVAENLDTSNFSHKIIELLFVIPFAIVTGLISILFIRGIYWTEDYFTAHCKNAYLRHATGMSLVGIMMYLFMDFYGHYYIDGIGFSTIQDTLNFAIINFGLLALLFIAKFLATCLTIGSGATGGIFSPALFLGATLGAAYSAIIHYFLPTVINNSAVFVVVGMASMLGSVTGVIITAMILILEITNDYKAALPIIMATIIAYLVRLQFSKESVYTWKLIGNYHH
ncbi:MAG: chloride channel protein [Gammaproteobacteria bacterium]